MRHLPQLLTAAALLTAASALACTNLLAGKKATTDGSVMVTYAADSHNLFGELGHTPAADHPKGAMRKVIEWDTSKPLGEIPQVPHTYNVVGNINENQVVIAESTWGGRPELVDTTGQAVIDYGSLMQIALERSKTAREAIQVMTSLVEKYGYASSGESFSIADKDELWVMEMIGKGAEKGAVWIAVRIPDEAISGHANEPRIRRVNFKDNKSDEPMPLYIIPDRKVSLAEMQERMRDHFEDTPFDMHNDIGAGPNHVPYRWRPMDYKVDGKDYVHERAIATQQTGWSFVTQSRAYLPDPVGGVIWFGTDDTNTSVYMPFYCSMTEVPHEVAHGNGDMNTFSNESNFWMTNWVANQAYNRYDLMIPDIRKVQSGLETKFIGARPDREKYLVQLYESGDMPKLVSEVNAEGAAIAKEATDSYRDLAQYLLVKFMDGNMKKTNPDGSFIYDENNHPVSPNFPGYNKEYYENIVRSTGDHFLVPPHK